MKLKFFNAIKKEVEERQYNVFIGISLGVLKPLTKETAKEYIKWALKNTKNKVVILIADEIAKFNYKVYSSYSEGKSERRAIREGDKYFDFFQKIIQEFSKEEQKKILILRWKDIWDRKKEKIKQIFDEEYKSNKDFKEQVQFFLKKYSDKRNKDLDKEKLDYLSQYILYELPTLLDGIEYKKEKYRLLLYPTFESSGMSEVVTKIQQGKIFPNLKKKLNLAEKTVVVETYLEHTH
ncbi:MAG: tRNA-dependent cyclodipeptide synthase [Candidatus Pacearchaeota archaeon]|nr:tRNA-dependent cyclodipeptide synthase [Candidatus Pacearchaeota archaeon]